MSGVSLSSLTKDNAYLSKIKTALESATGQMIPIIEIGKVKRTEGVSSVPVKLVFAGGQEAVLFVRASADVYKVTVNGKAFACTGDFSDDYQPTFNAGVTSLGDAIRKNQGKFDQARAKEKVRIPPARDAKGRPTPTSAAQVYKQILSDEAELDKQVQDKILKRDHLQQQIELLKAQASV